ncbi:hypothetical protein [Novosphingobium indicum]|nr:hypothetical protein [Novosphingobium indicum]
MGKPHALAMKAPGKITILLVTTQTFSACSIADESSRVSPIACEVALLHVKAFRENAGGPIAIEFAPPSDELNILTNKSIDEFLVDHPELRGDPDLPRQRKLAGEVQALKACTNLRDWYQKNSVTLNDREYNKLVSDAFDQRGSKLKGPIPFGFLSISAPALSDDGTQVFFSVRESNREIGNKFFVTYKKSNDGNWRIADKTSCCGVP